MTIITKNKQAYHDYEILETFEVGVILSGPEVKSVKLGQIDLKAGYVTIDKNQTPYLINVHIAPYAPAQAVQISYNPTRSRELLLHKKEIKSLTGKLQIRGLTILPLKVYTKGSLIKIEIGLARGKKKYDKRETIKKKELDRKIRQKLKQY
jgi:SsrA-binding protein